MTRRVAIIDFGRQFDPQPFHIDPEAAKSSLFGGLCASGYHTASMMMKLWVEHYHAPESSLGSPGVDDLRRHRPVFPGDRLSCRVTILESTPSRSRPSMGSVRQKCEVFKQNGELAMSLVGIGLFRKRDAAPA